MIDWSRLKDLRDEIGDDDFDEVVDMFLAEVDEVIVRLRGPNEDAALEHDLHFLKSSSLNLGFSAFAALCSEGEHSAAQGHPADLGSVFQSYDASLAAFQAGRNSLVGRADPL